MPEEYLFNDEELRQSALCSCPSCWAKWMAEHPMSYDTKAIFHLLEELEDIQDEDEKDEFVAVMMFIDDYLGPLDKHSKDEYRAAGRILRKYFESIGDLWSVWESLASQSLSTNFRSKMFFEFNINSLRRDFKELSIALCFSCPRYLRKRGIKR
jgi:hypothetical protein